MFILFTAATATASAFQCKLAQRDKKNTNRFVPVLLHTMYTYYYDSELQADCNRKTEWIDKKIPGWSELDLVDRSVSEVEMYLPAGTNSHLRRGSMNMDWQHHQIGRNIYLIKSNHLNSVQQQSNTHTMKLALAPSEGSTYKKYTLFVQGIFNQSPLVQFSLDSIFIFLSIPSFTTHM